MSRTHALKHANGQTTFCYDDNFTDPWRSHETVLIQHGFARHGAFWYHWVPVLAQKYRVIRRDARGHGRSSYPLLQERPDGHVDGGEKYDYCLDTVLDEILDTLDQLGIEKVHFLGESTSGMIGEALAAKYPHRLLSLTICSSPTYLPGPALEMFAFGHDSWPAACRELGPRGWATKLSQAPGTISVSEPGYLEWWLDQVAVSTSDGLAGYAEFLSALDARPFLKDIKIPMLILAPLNSAATKVEEQYEIGRQVKGSKVVVIEARGHEIYVENPGQCQQSFLEFLRDL